MKKVILLLLFFIFVVSICRSEEVPYKQYRADSFSDWSYVNVNVFTGNLLVAIKGFVHYGYISEEEGKQLIELVKNKKFEVISIPRGYEYDVLVSGPYEYEEKKRCNWQNISGDSLPAEGYTCINQERVVVLHVYSWDCNNLGLDIGYAEIVEKVNEVASRVIYMPTTSQSQSQNQTQEMSQQQSVSINIVVGGMGSAGVLGIPGYINYGPGTVYLGGVNVSAVRSSGDTINITSANSPVNNINITNTTGQPDQGTCGEGTPWTPVRP